MIALRSKQDNVPTCGLLIATLLSLCSCPAVRGSMVPDFSMDAYTGSVSEIAPTGTSVLTVTADPATSSPPSCIDSITYSILPVTVTQFRIEADGVIKTATELDYETQRSYTFDVAASDGCGEDTAAINITVLNADDSAPSCVFNVYYFSISESLLPFNTTYSLHCIDPDNLASSIIYSISSGNDALFDISGGHLSTLSQLDFESDSQHILTINVVKTLYLSAITEVTVIVTVLSSNEFPPVFSTELQLIYNVSESSLISTSIANITAVDEDDGYDGNVTYSFLTPQDHFIIDPVHGNLMVLQSLDREVQDMYTITIIARDSPLDNDTQRSSDVTILINVLDTNDNVPVFSRDLYKVSVIETTGNIVLMSLQCSDADLDTNAEITYQIISGNNLDQFNIDPSSGNLSVLNSLDYESQQFYNLKVMCSDGGTPSLSSVVSVVVEILSDNEFAPILSISPDGLYMIAEDRQAGDIITTISATDRDTGPAGVLVYSLDQANGTAALRCPPELFQINPSSGSLYLLSSLDKEAELPFTPPAGYTYECRLIVNNLQPRPESVHPLRLRVDNTNDIAPVCEPALNVVEVFEDLSVGSNVSVFACYDGDSLGLVYSITDTLAMPFDVAHNSTHGIVQLSSSLDYETQISYNFEIVVSDEGSPALSTTVMMHVNIKNVNEHSPMFPTRSGSIVVREDTVVGMILYRFSASDDDDSSDSLYYTIISGDDNGLVELDKLTGVLYLASSLDREAKDFFNITVQVDDHDSANPLTSLMQLNVSISDINDQKPLFSSAISFTSLDENVMVGSVFDAPICTDYDSGFNSALSCHISTACSYSISDDLCIPAPLPFSFNFSTGEASITSSLNYETAVFYEMEATCGDQGIPGLSSTAVLFVEVLPVNEFSPEFDSQVYSVSIAENTSIGESVLRITASDADGGLDGEVLYSLTENSSHFAIDPTTGWLIVTHHLDREQESTYNLYVVATDGSLSTQASVEIIVTDVNDNAPYCPQAVHSMRIPELLPTGSTVIQLDCTDADQEDGLLYTILSGNTGDVFSVHSNGSMVLSRSVHMEEVDSYHLIVSITDSSPFLHSVMIECFIYIARPNQPPAFNSSSSLSVSIPLSTASGSFLQAVSAFDQEVDKIYYSLNPSSSFIVIDKFNGGLFLVRSLSRDNVGQHRFLITISDLELNSSLDLTVTVVDDIEYMLMFEHSLYFVSVAEDEDVNTQLLSLQCTNQYGEPVENTHYHIPIASQRNFFRIEDLTGNVLLHQSLDFESANHHNITVACSDLMDRSTATIIVTVLPVNEHTPLFDPNTVEVNITENSRIGYVITQVAAVDQDHNNHLMYRLDEDFGLFHLDPFMGILYLKHPLDYEFQSVYNLPVIVSDEAPMVHSSTGNIIINVVDSNDNSPVCSPSYVTKVISDDFDIGDTVVSLSCSDGDTGINSQLVFSVLHNNSDLFSVHQTTGDITVARHLVASISSCFLTILVTDKGTPSLSTSVFVELSIVEHMSTSDNTLSTTSPTSEITSLDVERFSNSINITIADMTLDQWETVAESKFLAATAKFVTYFCAVHSLTCSLDPSCISIDNMGRSRGDHDPTNEFSNTSVVVHSKNESASNHTLTVQISVDLPEGASRPEGAVTTHVLPQPALEQVFNEDGDLIKEYTSSQLPVISEASSSRPPWMPIVLGVVGSIVLVAAISAILCFAVMIYKKKWKKQLKITPELRRNETITTLGSTRTASAREQFQFSDTDTDLASMENHGRQSSELVELESYQSDSLSEAHEEWPWIPQRSLRPLVAPKKTVVVWTNR